MGSLARLFNFGVSGISDTQLPEIFQLQMERKDFVQTDVETIYSKILTDTVERVSGLTEDQESTLWDSCLKSDNSEGLITMLSKAMANKRDLFLVYEGALKLLRHATQAERQQIEADYKAQGDSSTGIYVSFRNYKKSDMVRLYSELEYCVIASLNKSMNISKAMQLKINDMRSGVALADQNVAIEQAKKLAQDLGDGRDIMLDAKDMIEVLSPDLSSTKASMEFINNKLSYYLGLPEAYISGVLSGGLGSTGEGDTKGVERGLKNYYFSIVKPVLEKLFGIKASYKSQDFRQITQGFEALKTFELTDDSLLSVEMKRKIINQLFDVDTDGGTNN